MVSHIFYQDSKEWIDTKRMDFLFFVFERFMDWFAKRINHNVCAEYTTKQGKEVSLYIDWIGSKDI